jgi:hypothetical protein
MEKTDVDRKAAAQELREATIRTFFFSQPHRLDIIFYIGVSVKFVGLVSSKFEFAACYQMKRVSWKHRLGCFGHDGSHRKSFCRLVCV